MLERIYAVTSIYSSCLAALVGTAAAVSASASHILVKDEAKCLELKASIESSGDVMGKFTDLAKEHS